MTINFGATLRTNRATQVEATIGTSPKMQIRSGTKPANCAAADTGTLLAEITLPADWLTESGGVLTKSGTWETTGLAAGDAGHFRIKNNAGTVTHIQGSITVSGGGGDATVPNLSIGVGQPVKVLTFSLTEGNP